MTSCGCFEAIVALLPECNGVMIVNREHTGLTPAGMKFSTLAGNIGAACRHPASSVSAKPRRQQEVHLR